MSSAAATQTSVEQLLLRARSAQRLWARASLRERLHVIRPLRNRIAENALRFAALMPAELARTEADTLCSEVLPLADAARFLEKRAGHILRPRTLSAKGRPLLLRDVRIRQQYDPLGVVLIIGPANYPLFLPGSQMLQALVAGNAVLFKPGKGGARVAQLMGELGRGAGLPGDLITVLDEGIETAQDAIRAGVDKTVLTGSELSGRAVLKQAAENMTPAVVELSGCDAFIVLPAADIQKAARAVIFGIAFNGGATCIAPRRIIVHRAEAERFIKELSKILAPFPELEPAIVDNEEEALTVAASSRYALGATVFGPEREASAFAQRIPAGIVVVNDVIVPTVDPRVTFGGFRESGFGKTRGAEGLLEMTVVKQVVTQRAKRLRHLEALHPRAKQIFEAYISLIHGKGLRLRLGALLRLIKIGMSR